MDAYRFFAWQKTPVRPSPAHSKFPKSRVTENVIVVGRYSTPLCLKKARKLGYVGGLKTICGEEWIHDEKGLPSEKGGMVDLQNL